MPFILTIQTQVNLPKNFILYYATNYSIKSITGCIWVNYQGSSYPSSKDLEDLMNQLRELSLDDNRYYVVVLPENLRLDVRYLYRQKKLLENISKVSFEQFYQLLLSHAKIIAMSCHGYSENKLDYCSWKVPTSFMSPALFTKIALLNKSAPTISGRLSNLNLNEVIRDSVQFIAILDQFEKDVTVLESIIQYNKQYSANFCNQDRWFENYERLKFWSELRRSMSQCTDFDFELHDGDFHVLAYYLSDAEINKERKLHTIDIKVKQEQDLQDEQTLESLATIFTHIKTLKINSSRISLNSVRAIIAAQQRAGENCKLREIRVTSCNLDHEAGVELINHFKGSVYINDQMVIGPNQVVVRNCKEIPQDLLDGLIQRVQNAPQGQKLTIELDRCTISDDHLVRLLDATGHLEVTLKLTGGTFHPEMRIPAVDSVASLDLSGNMLFPSSLSRLGETLQSPSLSELSLANVRVHPDDIENLTTVLITAKNLNHLDLTEMGVERQQLITMMETLLTLSETLTVITLNNSHYYKDISFFQLIQDYRQVLALSEQAKRDDSLDNDQIATLASIPYREDFLGKECYDLSQSTLLCLFQTKVKRVVSQLPNKISIHSPRFISPCYPRQSLINQVSQAKNLEDIQTVVNILLRRKRNKDGLQSELNAVSEALSSAIRDSRRHEIDQLIDDEFVVVDCNIEESGNGTECNVVPFPSVVPSAPFCDEEEALGSYPMLTTLLNGQAFPPFQEVSEQVTVNPDDASVTSKSREHKRQEDSTAIVGQPQPMDTAFFVARSSVPPVQEEVVEQEPVPSNSNSVQLLQQPKRTKPRRPAVAV